MKELAKLPIYSPNEKYLAVKEIAEDNSLAIVPNYEIVSYRNVLLTPTHHVYVKGKYVPTGVINMYDDKNLPFLKRIYLLLKFRFFGKVAYHSGNFLFAHDIWSSNYYHWLCEVLPRLMLMHKKNSRSVVILPSSLQQSAFVAASLNMLKISYEYFDMGVSHAFTMLTTVQCSPPLANINPVLQRSLKHNLLKALGINLKENAWRKIYISRANASYRRIENEQEIIPVLVQHGYEIIYAETLSYKEQVVLFYETAYCIALHGAGLTNCMFMQPASSVMEIRISTWSKQPLCFWRLANSFHLKWRCHLAMPATEESNFKNVTIGYESFCKDLEAFHE